jgi:hypothetical protein
MTFSDKPCPDGHGTAKFTLGGQPKMAEDQPAQPLPQPASSEAQPEPDAPPPPARDARGEQLRRLEFLLGQLVNGVAQADSNCASATSTMQGWLQNSAGEARDLWPAWQSVEEGGEPAPGEELVAFGELIGKKVREFESETLTRLTARCWDSQALNDTVDAVREQLPGR